MGWVLPVGRDNALKTTITLSYTTYRCVLAPQFSVGIFPKIAMDSVLILWQAPALQVGPF